MSLSDIASNYVLKLLNKTSKTYDNLMYWFPALIVVDWDNLTDEDRFKWVCALSGKRIIDDDDKSNNDVISSPPFPISAITDSLIEHSATLPLPEDEDEHRIIIFKG